MQHEPPRRPRQPRRVGDRDGAPQRILGDLGTTISAFRDGLDDPSELLAPLGGLLEELLDAVDLGDLPLADYLAAVREGAEILQGVVGALNGDLNELAPIGAAQRMDIPTTDPAMLAVRRSPAPTPVAATRIPGASISRVDEALPCFFDSFTRANTSICDTIQSPYDSRSPGKCKPLPFPSLHH